MTFSLTADQYIALCSIVIIALIAYINNRFDDLYTHSDFITMNSVLLRITQMYALKTPLPQTMTKSRIFCENNNIVIVNYNNQFICGRNFNALHYDDIRIENHEWINYNRGNPWTIIPFVSKFAEKYAM